MPAESPASPLISPDTLEAMLSEDRDGTVLIDTRPPEIWAHGHIAGAANMHDIFTYLATSTKAGKTEMRNKFTQLFGQAGLGGEQTAVFYEDQMDTGFGQSCRGYVILRYLGYPDDKMRILDGGISAWKAQGKPTVAVNNMATPIYCSHEPRLFPDLELCGRLLVNREEILEVVKSKAAAMSCLKSDVVLVDTRDEPEWLGKTSSPYGIDFCPRMGRIPGSVWIEWTRMIEKTETGARMLRTHNVIKIMEEFGITPDSSVIVFCFKGARASLMLVALRDAGVKDVRLYMGSWNEWSRDLALPIVVV